MYFSSVENLKMNLNNNDEKKEKLKLYLISINYIYKMKKIISYIYKKCWDIIANPSHINKLALRLVLLIVVPRSKFITLVSNQ